MVEPTGVEPATFSLPTRGANREKRRFTRWVRKIPPPKGTDQGHPRDELRQTQQVQPSLASREGSEQMALSKSVAGAAFEVAFESLGAFQCFERPVEFDFPRSELGGMRAMATVVVGQALLQVGRVAVVELIRSGVALENVGIEHRPSPFDGLPSIALNPNARPPPLCRQSYGGHHPSL